MSTCSPSPKFYPAPGGGGGGDITILAGDNITVDSVHAPEYTIGVTPVPVWEEIQLGDNFHPTTGKIVMYSPDGNGWIVTVSNAGVLTVVPLT